MDATMPRTFQQDAGGFGADAPGSGIMDRDDFLEISPYQADEGELIGKHPSDVPLEILSLKFRAQNPLRAIREKCIDCCCANVAEVRKCVAVDCALWPYRLGTNPFRKKRELTSEQKQAATARLRASGANSQ